jgi:hypothetical protein
VFVALLHTVVLGAALRVEGETSCPSPAQVAADVQKILGLSDEYAPKVHATLTRDGAWIDLKLSESDGTSLGERRLEASEDCVVLSRAAAVVLAAWLTDQHPEFLVALPATPEATTPTDAAHDANGTPRGATQPAPTPPATAVVQQPNAVAATKPSAPTPSTHRLALGAAIGGGWASSQFVPAAWLGASLAPVTSGWGAQISAAWLGAYSERLGAGAGKVSWTRWPLMAGPYVRFAFGSATVELEAGPALGWLRLEGQQFAPDTASSHSHTSLGGYGALRFMPKAGAWHPFLMVAPVYWPGRVTAATNDSASQTRLPSVELLFAAGVRILP